MTAILSVNLNTPKKEYSWGNNHNWAIRNIKHGRSALICGTSITAINSVKNVIDKESIFYKTIDLLNAFLLGLRNHEQYSIYSNKKDDDLGEDLVKRPYAGNIGNVACFIEKYINPFLIPICYFIGEKAFNTYNSICHLPNALWWRSRLVKETIQWKYFNSELVENINIIFSSNEILEKEQALDDVMSNITPLLGLIGLTFTGLFTSIKSFNKLFENENKFINSLCAIGNTSQHLYYFLKFTIPEYFKIERKENDNNKTLFTTGLSANVLNGISPLLELLPDDKKIISPVKKLLLDLSTGCTMMFFSFRRYCMGREIASSYKL